MITSGMALIGFWVSRSSLLCITCARCVKKLTGNVSTQELSVMKQSIDELDRKIANILKVVKISVDVTPDVSKGTLSSSYSQALSKNL